MLFILPSYSTTSSNFSWSVTTLNLTRLVKNLFLRSYRFFLRQNQCLFLVIFFPAVVRRVFSNFFFCDLTGFFCDKSGFFCDKTLISKNYCIAVLSVSLLNYVEAVILLEEVNLIEHLVVVLKKT